MSNEIEMITVFPTYKPLRRINNDFKNKLRKALAKVNPRFRPKFKPYVEELNQFIYGSITTADQEYLEIEPRVDLETTIHKINRVQSTKILKELEKILQKDPELRNSKNAFSEIIEYLNLGNSDLISKIEDLPGHTINHIQNIFTSSGLMIWDLPGEAIDRIIIGSEVINREGDEMAELDIAVISDELALASLGKHHVPILCDLVIRIDKIFGNLPEKLGTFNSSFDILRSEEERQLLFEVASVYLGKMLGVREPISLALKQLQRYLDLKDEMEQEGGQIGSSFLVNLYSQLVDTKEIHDVISLLDKFLEIVSENADSMRNILNTIEKCKIGENGDIKISEFVNFAGEIYLDLEEFRFVTETFQDIPSFTAMGGGVAVEAAESQITDIKQEHIIYLRDIFRTFPLINSTVYALRGIDLTINKGEFVAIMGPSGSGKTTLLNIISGLDRPDRGIAYVSGLNISTAKEKDLINFRRTKAGFIYQSYNLLPVLKNRENVSLPADIAKKEGLGNTKKRSKELLTKVGLADYINETPLTLSGGQQQRVTIARALMNKPDILFCDEPTGDLDSKTGMEVMAIIQQFHKEGVTVVLVTHDQSVADLAERTIKMQDGKIIS